MDNETEEIKKKILEDAKELKALTKKVKAWKSTPENKDASIQILQALRDANKELFSLVKDVENAKKKGDDKDDKG